MPIYVARGFVIILWINYCTQKLYYHPLEAALQSAGSCINIHWKLCYFLPNDHMNIAINADVAIARLKMNVQKLERLRDVLPPRLH